MNPPPGNWNAKARNALNTHFWLILSLIGNFALAFFLYLATDSLKEPPVVVPAVENATLLKTNVVVRRENFTWDTLESTNYAVFIRNLRAVGCPEQTIRDIIVSEVNRIYQHHRLEDVNYPSYQWWRADPDQAAVQQMSDKLQELEAERRSVLTSLLGAGWDAEDNEEIAAKGGITLTGPILGDLPAATKAAVYAIAARGQMKIEAYETRQRNSNKPDDPMEMVRLREEPLAQLTSVLTPAQYEEYALRYSPSAQDLREEMRPINLTQEQFRGLYVAINSINGQPVYYYDGTDSMLLKEQQQLRSQAAAVIKATLGEDLYAAYQLAQDPVYRSAESTAAQLGVPASEIKGIYEINRATQSELDRIRKNPDLSNDEKVEAISQTKVEQEQSLEQLLGQEAFQKWLQTHTGLQ